MSQLVGVFLTVLFFTTIADAGTLQGKVTVRGSSDNRDVMVYVDGVRGDFSPPEVPPAMDHRNLRFNPPVLAVLKGTTVPFSNSDPVFHSAFSVSPSNPFDLGIYGRGRKKSVHFQHPGMVEIFCHIHVHMRGYVLVTDNPYVATTDHAGRYVITHIPEGDYTVRAWKNSSVVIERRVKIRKDDVTVLDVTFGF